MARGSESTTVDRLTATEASFLEAEDADPDLSLAIGTLAIIDGPIPARAKLTAALSKGLHAVPRLAQLVRKHPFELTPPEWVGDNDFDITRHVRSAALPRPGDDAALFQTIAELMEPRLARNHPLWECWVIDGLPDGRWAALIKIHQCIADATATLQILASISDPRTYRAVIDEIHAAEEQRSAISRQAGLGLNPLTWVGEVWRTSVATANAAAHSALGAAELATGLVAGAADSRPNGVVTDTRRYSAVRVARRGIDEVCEIFDVTPEDVALAAITDSFRGDLLRRGEKPRRTSVRALVPISAQTSDALNRSDIRGPAAILPCLPVEEDDPVQRLRLVHTRLDKAKKNSHRQAASSFVTLSSYVPFIVSAWTVRLLTRLPQRSVVALATGVPGTRQRLQMLGRPVEELLPIPPIAPQLPTVITMLSYVDTLVFGITGDCNAAIDVGELATGIELGIARLLARALARKQTRGKQSGPDSASAN
ncbi:wax ester/triacylglycerol synthase family O-acyltransferase [Mycobacterium sp.]|uniref:wax ester/triacylglycerol synthase family O-acyltransferase n=1 Tax=Mycobacterium sp. TaxID=1785 RepID=UPI002BF40BEC|nr:wax ester/triacylglycerol synthase family O-acyltransferase [Mycobacterium sp.]HTQ15808.1 wax ester/triacylglycerol synthase family O-acyltransferase [Mycobacterium sp.]